MNNFENLLQDIRKISADMCITGVNSEHNNNLEDIKALNEILDTLRGIFTFMDLKSDHFSNYSLEHLTKIATIDFKALQSLYKWYSEIPVEAYFSYENYIFFEQLNEFRKHIEDNVECIRQYINEQTQPIEE